MSTNKATSNIMDIAPVRDALRGFQNEIHNKIGAKYSITELLGAARPRQLEIRNTGPLANYFPNEVGLWRAFSGTGVHAMFERFLGNAPQEWLVEGRVWDVINGVRIAGLFDAFHIPKGTLYDFKLTRIYKWKLKDFSEWTEQQNIYAWLLGDNFHVRSLNIVAIWIDYFPIPFRKPDPNWPEDMITVIPLEQWKPARTREFVEGRIAAHEEAEQLPTEELPPCTDKERWQTTLYKVVPKGQKRALRSTNSRAEAESFVFKYGNKLNRRYRTSDLEIRTVVGEPKRCRDWCKVAPFCDQWQDELDSAGNWRAP